MTEVRTLAGVVEYRAADSGVGVLTGYAAVFNRYSQNLGGFVERVDPAAFTKTLGDGRSVMARYNHDNAYLLGTTDSGTLTLSVDGTGLPYVIDLPDTEAGRTVAVLARRGDLRHSSFAFETLEDEWDVTDQGFPLRTLLSVRLIDVAPVNEPAYLDTTAGLRSLSARIGADAATLGAEEIRALLTPPAPPVGQPEGGPVDNHPSPGYDRARVLRARLAVL